MINQAILCVNTFSQTHEEEAATRKHYVGLDMTNSVCLLQMWRMLHQVWKCQSPPCETQIFPHFPPWDRALFNYSKIVLTVDIIDVLNCGLNFYILLIMINQGLTKHQEGGKGGKKGNEMLKSFLAAMLLSASVERGFVSRMRDF